MASDTHATLAAFTFPDMFRASEFLTATLRLSNDKSLVLKDAVYVIKGDDGRAHVEETTDVKTASAAMGGGLWAGLFGLLLGGPVGMLAAGGVGAGVGAIAAKAIDIGISDSFVDDLREMVAPGTVTLALLVDHIDEAVILAELQRFEGARYVAGNLPIGVIEAVRGAVGDPQPMHGEPLPPPTV